MNTIPPRLVMFSGLGADRRLFQELEATGLEFEIIEWIKPAYQESLSDYAARMASRISFNGPIVIGGVSLGGMIAGEVSRHLDVEKVLIISSVKSSREVPFYFKLFRYIPIHRYVSGEWLKRYGPRNPFRMEGRLKNMLRQMRSDSNPEFVKWAINAVLTWKQPKAPQNYVHIHGTRDLMFPGFLLGERHKIRKGSHVMVFTHAEEIGRLIRRHVLEEDI